MLGKVSIAIEAAMARFESDMGRAARVMEKELKRMEGFAKRHEAEMKKAGQAIGLAIAAGVGVATAALRQSIDRMDELSKAAQRVQMPTDEFSRLVYAGELADVAMNDIVSSMGRLTRAQAAAAQGNRAQVDAFKALGIEYKNADGSLRSTTEVFRDFADRFQKFKGSPEITALGMQLFGRSFQTLIPLLKDGSAGLAAAADESDRLGRTVSDQAGRAAEEFNDNLTRLKSIVQGVANSVAADLLPDLVSLSENLLSNSSEGNRLKSVAQDLTRFLRGLGAMAHWVSSAFEIMGTGIASSIGLAQSFVSFAKGNAATSARQGRAAIGLLADEYREAFGTDGKGKGKPQVTLITADSGGIRERDRKPLATPDFDPPSLARSGGSKGGGKKSDADRAAEQLDRAYESANERMREQIALFGQTGEAARVRYEIEQGAMKGLDAAKAAVLIKDAEHLDLLEDIAEQERIAADIAKEVQQDQQRRLDQFQNVIGAIEDEITVIGMSANAQEVWNNLKWAGVDAESAWGRQIVAATGELQRQREAMDGQIRAFDAVRSASSGLFEDLMSGTKSWKDAFKDAADAIVASINRIIAQRLVEQMFGQQGSAGGGSAGGGWGAVLGSLFGGKRELGGPVWQNKAYLVGERGPEMFVPRTAGTIVPAGETSEMMAGGGSVNTVNNFAFAAPVSSKTQTQIAARVAFEQARARRLGR